METLYVFSAGRNARDANGRDPWHRLNDADSVHATSLK